MMPTPDPTALAGAQTFQLPSATNSRQRAGPLFNAALMAAGRDGCDCKCCQYVKRLRDLMVDDAEEMLRAPDG